MTVQKMTFAQMRKSSKAADHNWFSRGAMEFFNTVIVSNPDRWNMFIISNQYKPEENTPLIYKVVIHIPKNGKTFNVCDNDGFALQEEAEAYRKALAKAFDTAQARELYVIEDMVAIGASSNTTTFYHASEERKFEVRLSDARIIG